MHYYAATKPSRPYDVAFDYDDDVNMTMELLFLLLLAATAAAATDDDGANFVEEFMSCV